MEQNQCCHHQPTSPSTWGTTKQPALFTKPPNSPFVSGKMTDTSLKCIILKGCLGKRWAFTDWANTTVLKINMRSNPPEFGHSCKALAIRVFAMFFSPALYSSLTDSNLVTKTPSDDIYCNTFTVYKSTLSHLKVTGNYKHMSVWTHAHYGLLPTPLHLKTHHFTTTQSISLIIFNLQ